MLAADLEASQFEEVFLVSDLWPVFLYFDRVSLPRFPRIDPQRCGFDVEE